MSWTPMQVEGLAAHYFKTRGEQVSGVTGCRAHYLRQGLPGGGPSRDVFQKAIDALVAKRVLRVREERISDTKGGWETAYEIATTPPEPNAPVTTPPEPR